MDAITHAILVFKQILLAIAQHVLHQDTYRSILDRSLGDVFAVKKQVLIMENHSAVMEVNL